MPGQDKTMVFLNVNFILKKYHRNEQCLLKLFIWRLRGLYVDFSGAKKTQACIGDCDYSLKKEWKKQGDYLKFTGEDTNMWLTQMSKTVSGGWCWCLERQLGGGFQGWDRLSQWL